MLSKVDPKKSFEKVTPESPLREGGERPNPQIMRGFFGLLFLCIITTAKSNPLVGEPHYCSREGALVPVSTSLLGFNSCRLLCYCKNHMVQCNPTHCPSVEGCYRLQPRPSPECCQTCLGCAYGNTDISHGHSWQEKCRFHECQAGVLTTSDIECYVPCTSPLPPAEGECCQRCLGCWLEGRSVRDGSISSSRLDPCVRCSCSKGFLTCSKRSCPVLSCPPNKAVLGPDGCCPVCNGSREMYIPPGGRCFLGKYFYKQGDNRTFDQCTTCSCHLSYLTCEKKTCPALQCPEPYQKTTSDQCCPTCTYPSRSQICMTDGIRRQHGDVWRLDTCSSCTCTQGQVTCHVDHCEYFNKECPVGFRKEKSEEDCCPRCIEEPGVCVTYGDPHYKTFDNYLFNFQGECRYELAKDCFGDMFSVRVNNDARRSSYFSWTRSLSLKLVFEDHKHKISLGQRLRTKVNRKRVKLPYFDKSYNITRKAYLITVQTNIGVQVIWDGASYVEVKVDPMWRNRTCGLCGNFNRKMEDDKRNKKGKLASTNEEMAISWQSGKTKSCSRRLRFRIKPDKGSVRTQRLTCVNSQLESNERCEILNHTIFDECQKLIPRENFYSSCLLDLCECPLSRMCECDSLVAYVRECERAHVQISEWKAATRCGGFECPYGSIYMDCAPACKPSCKNQKPNPNCHMKRCKPGCYCPPPTVLHRGSCILPDQCPMNTRSRKS